MDDKTIGLIIMGVIVVGFGVFTSYMASRQREREEHPERYDDRQQSLI